MLSLAQRTTLNPLQTKTIKCRQSLGRSERLLQNTPFLDRYPLWPGCRNGIPDEGAFGQRAASMSRTSSQAWQSERYPIRRFALANDLDQLAVMQFGPFPIARHFSSARRAVRPSLDPACRYRWRRSVASTRCYGNDVVGSGANDQVTLEIMYWSRVMAVSSHILCW